MVAFQDLMDVLKCMKDQSAVLVAKSPGGRCVRKFRLLDIRN